jgi:predicted dehydrogenase
MNKPLLRWGILGCANIARKNWKAILKAGTSRVVAVASRDLQRSRQFVAECQAEAPFDPAPRAIGSYEELLAAKDIDAVYVPLPTGIRAQWLINAAEAGKHLVCEKPCATSTSELLLVLDACRRNHVQFMDGVMFMHSRRLARMREALDDGQTVGPIRRIASAFSFKAPEEFFVSNIRAQSGLEPGGCLGDLGWYCIRFSLWAMNWAMPERVVGHALTEYQHPHNPSSVPIEFSGELFFSGGLSSTFYCSFLTETEQWAMISGEKGHLRLQDFVLPFSGTETVFDTGNPQFNVRGCDFEMLAGNRRWVTEEHSHGDPTAQEARLFANFTDEIQSGTLSPLWPEIALKTQVVMDACRQSSLQQGQPVPVGTAQGG